MEISSLVGYGGSFLIGVAVGAAGKYFGDIFTDQRKRGEAAKKEKANFENLCKSFPELIGKMRADWSRPDNETVRILYSFPNGRLNPLHTRGKRGLEYPTNENPNILDLLVLMEQYGFVEVSRQDGLYFFEYLVEERFIKLLRDE